jgi:hypothetical protein
MRFAELILAAGASRLENLSMNGSFSIISNFFPFVPELVGGSESFSAPDSVAQLNDL